MNYETAKKLKDAGFPQQGSATCTHPLGHTEESLQEIGEDVVIPTLSELIEACGEGFSSLSYWDSKYWQATGKGVGMVGYTSASTPEIAIANLWLELNKK